jgi:chromosome segregation ATPase
VVTAFFGVHASNDAMMREEREPAMAIDEEIDRLYQLPLPDFTAARNALAARAGARAAEIRRLPKPNVAAWAVNQIYWHRSKIRDRLETVSRRLREAHAHQLAGKRVDIAAAEAAHRAAVTAAVAEARELLSRAGDGATAATVQAVSETLETVVWHSLDGRLSRPLKRTGLEALAALKGGTLTGAGRPAQILAFAKPPHAGANKADETKRRAADRRREAAAVARDLKSAQAAERKADAALARARDLVADAERQRARLTDELEQATARLADRRTDFDRARAQAERAAADRSRLDGRLASLKEPGT